MHSFNDYLDQENANECLELFIDVLIKTRKLIVNYLFAKQNLKNAMVTS